MVRRLLFLALVMSVVCLGFKFPERRGFVNDYAGALSTSAVHELQYKLGQIALQTGIYIVVATLPTLNGDDIDSYANMLFERWGVGKKGEDNGVLVLVAMAERQVRIEVGYGLESILNDAKVGRIIRDEMLPRFKTGDVEGGILAGVNAIYMAVSGEELNLDEDVLDASKAGRNSIFGLVASIIMILLAIRYPWLLFFLPIGGFRGGRGFGSGFVGGAFGGGLSGGGGARGSW